MMCQINHILCVNLFRSYFPGELDTESNSDDSEEESKIMSQVFWNNIEEENVCEKVSSQLENETAKLSDSQVDGGTEIFQRVGGETEISHFYDKNLKKALPVNVPEPNSNVPNQMVHNSYQQGQTFHQMHANHRHPSGPSYPNKHMHIPRNTINTSKGELENIHGRPSHCVSNVDGSKRSQFSHSVPFQESVSSLGQHKNAKSKRKEGSNISAASVESSEAIRTTKTHKDADDDDMNTDILKKACEFIDLDIGSIEVEDESSLSYEVHSNSVKGFQYKPTVEDESEHINNKSSASDPINVRKNFIQEKFNSISRSSLTSEKVSQSTKNSSSSKEITESSSSSKGNEKTDSASSSNCNIIYKRVEDRRFRFCLINKTRIF
ncbi:hypothetical protein Anas_02876 [Armadillidium nasatum]|uniref:Uncharacterized protein n=1 Tax=Armadillidium nasatum TaxID=96803 RepID=A0A5N5THU7_9CRUS|nr:hypothetical protein Anas_02876 [Armadillidium nasatum]